MLCTSCISLRSWLAHFILYFSEDGSINIYTVRDGMYVRSIFPATFGSAVYKLDHIELSYQGHVVLAGHSQDVHSMHVYTINGHLLTSRLAMWHCQIPDVLHIVWQMFWEGIGGNGLVCNNSKLKTFQPNWQ